jgi:hypothetical protein
MAQMGQLQLECGLKLVQFFLSRKAVNIHMAVQHRTRELHTLCLALAITSLTLGFLAS